MCKECGCEQQDRDMMFDREKGEHYAEGSDKNIEELLNEMNNLLDFVGFEFIFPKNDGCKETYQKVEKIIRGLNKDSFGRMLVKHLLEMDESDPVDLLTFVPRATAAA